MLVRFRGFQSAFKLPPGPCGRTLPRSSAFATRGYSSNSSSVSERGTGHNSQRERFQPSSRIRFIPIHPPTHALSKPVRLQLDSVHFSIHALRLRDACTCSACIDPSTKQRNFETADLDSDLSWVVNDELQSGGLLNVTWMGSKEHSHVSSYSKEQLRTLLGPRTFRARRGGPSRIPWDSRTYQSNQHWLSFDEYMHDDAKFKHIMRSLYRYGLVFVKEVPRSTESVSQIATRMGPLRNSFYGLTWDVRSVPEAKNVAYTNKFLDFHMDLLYMADPPGYQLLHCVDNSLPGGESMFSDTLRAAQTLRKEDPEAFSILANNKVRFAYNNDGQNYEYARSTIVHEGDEIAHVNYSPPFQAPFVGARGNLDPFHNAIRKFSRILKDPKNVFQLKLQPGECVIFANRRVVHARQAFDLSEASDQERSRWLRGAYVDEDALLSKFSIFREQNPEEWDQTLPEQWSPDLQ